MTGQEHQAEVPMNRQLLGELICLSGRMMRVVNELRNANSEKSRIDYFETVRRSIEELIDQEVHK
jgi:hypothetical protein